MKYGVIGSDYCQTDVVRSVAFKELNDVSDMAKLDVARTIDKRLLAVQKDSELRIVFFF